jgi:hypothetical protein
MANYAIDDAYGNQISCGIQTEHEALRRARRLANERGEPVYVYDETHVSTGDGNGYTAVEPNQSII